jgi:hypothetical protein
LQLAVHQSTIRVVSIGWWRLRFLNKGHPIPMKVSQSASPSWFVDKCRALEIFSIFMEEWSICFVFKVIGEQWRIQTPWGLFSETQYVHRRSCAIKRLERKTWGEAEKRERWERS